MKQLFLILFLFAGLSACVDENADLGRTLVSSSFYNVYVDTCTVDISTVLEDSIVTRGDSICQIGHYRDGTWGEVTAAYYAEYSTASFTPNENYSYTLDSLVLVMRHSGHYWGDTLTTPLIHIYRLAAPIELLDDEDLYNHTTLPTESPLPSSVSATVHGLAGVKCRPSACRMNGDSNCWTILSIRRIILTTRNISKMNFLDWPLCLTRRDSVSVVFWSMIRPCASHCTIKKYPPSVQSRN